MNIEADRTLAAGLIRHALASLPAALSGAANPLAAALSSAAALIEGGRAFRAPPVEEDAGLALAEVRHAPRRRLMRQVERLVHDQDPQANPRRRRDLALAVRLVFLAGEGALRSPSGRAALADAGERVGGGAGLRIPAG